MVLFGLLLLVVGVLLVLAGLFGTGIEVKIGGGTQEEHVTVIGLETSPVVLFLLGVVAAVLILGGLWVMKYGAKQGWRRRKEQKRLGELSEQLERAEAERRGDDEDQR